jgi:hypothetical protein
VNNNEIHYICVGTRRNETYERGYTDSICIGKIPRQNSYRKMNKNLNNERQECKTGHIKW